MTSPRFRGRIRAASGREEKPADSVLRASRVGLCWWNRSSWGMWGCGGLGLERRRWCEEESGPEKRNPTVMPCINSSFELLETGRDALNAVRLPVKACRRYVGTRSHQLYRIRFKDIVSNHEHGRVKSGTLHAFQRAAGLATGLTTAAVLNFL